MTNKYDNYKYSGVECFGEIPNHWEISRIKNLFIGKSGIGFKEEDQGVLEADYPFFKVSDTNNYGNEKYLVNANNYIFKGSKYVSQLIPKDSIIAPKVGEVLRSNKRRILKSKSVIDNNMLALIPKNENINTNYFYYLSLFIDFNKYINSGAVPSINYGQVSIIEILKFPIQEQKLIADYLDEKTSSIDNSIETLKSQKERLIEQKKAIIHKAVTKGLDDSVEMKDSGVDWIKEIPKNWRIDKLKNSFLFKKGVDSQKYNKVYVLEEKNKGDYPVYSGQTKDNGVMGKIKTYDYEFESVLFTTTVGAKFMTPMILKGRFSLSQNCLLIINKNKNKNSNKYYYYYLQSFFEYEKNKMNNIITPSLRNEDLEKYIIFKPEIEEQIKIANYLDEKTSKIEEAVNEVEKQINLLEEYKKTLINDVVTGKIKVF